MSAERVERTEFKANLGLCCAVQAAYEKFVSEHKEQGLDGRDIQLAKESVQHNIAWLKRNRVPLGQYLDAEEAKAQNQ